MGRLPTSGYCVTCTQRRVKCDRSRPACQRCLKSGHACKGYETLQVRMFGVPRPLQRHASIKSLTKASSVRDPVLAAPQGEFNMTTSCLDVHLDYFLSSYRWAHWWKALLHHGLRGDSSSAGYKSTESLLLGYFAVGHQDTELLVKSRRSYGEALRDLSSALTFQPTEDFPELSLPIMILSMHPVRPSPTLVGLCGLQLTVSLRLRYVVDKSFELEHHIGLETVVMHCGPGGFQGPGIVDTFRSCRAMLVCQGLAKRRRTFLETEHWKTIPFVGTTKTTMDMLYDILVHVPGLFGDASSSSGADSPPGAREILIQVVEALQQDLYAWQRARDLESSIASTSRVVPVPSVGVPAETEEQLPNLACSRANPAGFDNIHQALEVLTFNTTAICLSKLREMLAGSHNTTSQHGMSFVGSTVETQIPPHTALELVQQCAYIAQEIKRSRAVNFLALAPVGVAYCALKSGGDPGNQLAACIAQMFRSERFLAELEVFELWK